MKSWTGWFAVWALMTATASPIAAQEVGLMGEEVSAQFNRYELPYIGTCSPKGPSGTTDKVKFTINRPLYGIALLVEKSQPGFTNFQAANNSGSMKIGGRIDPNKTLIFYSDPRSGFDNYVVEGTRYMATTSMKYNWLQCANGVAVHIELVSPQGEVFSNATLGILLGTSFDPAQLQRFSDYFMVP